MAQTPKSQGGKGNAQIPIPTSPKQATHIKMGSGNPGSKYGQDPHKKASK